MVFSLVLLATFVLNHLLIGLVLLAVLYAVNKVVRFTPELACVVWTTAFLLCTVSPFFLVKVEEKAPLLSAHALSAQSIQTDSSKANITVLRGADSTPNSEPAFINTWLAKPSLQVPAKFVFENLIMLSTLVAVAFIGSLWRIFNLLISALRTRHLLALSTPYTQLDGITGSVPVLQSANLSSPIAVGLLNPQIVLPTRMLAQLSKKDIAPVLLHEYAHIKRGDLWVGGGQEMLAVLFWWSPVMRNINYKIHINRELACDLRAVRQLNSAKQYAQALLDCTRLMLAKKHNLLTMGLFGKKKELNQRIEMVLSSKHQRVPGLAKQLLVAIAMVSISMGAARAWVPQVDVTDMNAQARQLSSLTDNQSEVVRSAILRGNVQALQQIIDGGLDINTPMQSDGTALMMAVEAGNQFVVEQLLGMGADPNQPSLGDGNPLIVAARTNNAALAQLLIDHGADVNAIVPYDETPLITASRYGAFTTLKLLVEQGADVNLGVMVNEIGGNNQFRSPLNMANTSVIEDYLRENGATKE